MLGILVPIKTNGSVSSSLCTYDYLGLVRSVIQQMLRTNRVSLS